MDKTLNLNFKMGAPLIIEQLVDQDFKSDLSIIDAYQKDVDAILYIHSRAYITTVMKNIMLDKIHRLIIQYIVSIN